MAEIDLKAKITVAPVITEIKATDDKKLFIRWKKSPLAEKYDVMRSFSPEGEFVHIDWATDTEFTDTTAERDALYWYKIVAWKRMENKKTSKKASKLKAAVASDISAPQNFRVKADKGNILLSWKNAQDCSCNIYRRSEFFSRPSLIGSSKNGSFTDETAVSGQVYYYSLQSVKQGDGKALYGNFTDELACAFIDTVQIASSKKSWGRAAVEVNVVAGADGYIFERSDSKNGDFTEVGRTEDIVGVTFEEKLPSRLRAYYYRARAFKRVDDKELFGGYSPVKPLR